MSAIATTDPKAVVGSVALRRKFDGTFVAQHSAQSQLHAHGLLSVFEVYQLAL